MSVVILPYRELKPEKISAIKDSFGNFYQNPPPSYYSMAETGNEQYTEDIHPFHCDLVKCVKPGVSVLEIGCGTAHLCRHVENAGGRYVGVDHSRELLAKNQSRYPSARFFPLETLASDLQEKFDMVVSLYTIEHVVDPPEYLDRMWSYCKPGGLIGVICPAFVDGDSLAASIFMGLTPRRFREKLRQGNFIDAACHLFDYFWAAPRWKKRARQSPPGAFWINLQPTVLNGGPYTVDADAVHLPRLADLESYLRQKGAAILRTSSTMQGISSQVSRFNCYLLVQKPQTATA